MPSRLQRAGRCLRTVALAIAVGALSAPPTFATTPVKIAMLPMVVHSSESPEYLRQGLADMLASRFEQLEVFEVIRVEDPRKATTRLATALETGRAAGADMVLFGSFTRFGQGASLDVQAAATKPGADGQTLREIFVHSGSIGEVIPDLDDLVGKVTRFAVPGYALPVPAVPAAAGAPRPAVTRRDIEELTSRIEALEESLRGAQTE
jgi:TolB-like protein